MLDKGNWGVFEMLGFGESFVYGIRSRVGCNNIESIGWL